MNLLEPSDVPARPGVGVVPVGGSSRPHVDDSGAAGLPRPALAQPLADAEDRTLAELAAVGGSLWLATQAALSADLSIAAEVTRRAGDMNRRYKDIHDRVLSLIACQGPVAADLRLALALLHVNDRAERMSAQCTNIATLCCAMPEQRPSRAQLGLLATMAALVDAQVSEAARTFAQRDVDGARRLHVRGLAVIACNRRCFLQGVEDGGEQSRRAAAMLVTHMARALERVGDNAGEIGRQACFVATGRLRPAARRQL